MISTNRNFKINLKDPLQQTLSLIFASTFSLLGLIFIIFSYYDAKNEAGVEAGRQFERIKTTVGALSELKKKELNSSATILSVSANLRSALATDHESTIIDVLEEIRKSQNLKFVAIIKDKQLLFSSSENNSKELKEIVAGNFLGKAEIKINSQKNVDLLIGSPLNMTDLNFWSEATQGNFIIFEKNGAFLFDNVSEEQARTFLSENQNSLIVSKNNKYYMGSTQLLGDTLKINILIEKAPYFQLFIKKRNKLFVIGTIITLLGLISGIFLAVFVSHLVAHNSQSDKNSENNLSIILEQIEEINKKINQDHHVS